MIEVGQRSGLGSCWIVETMFLHLKKCVEREDVTRKTTSGAGVQQLSELCRWSEECKTKRIEWANALFVQPNKQLLFYHKGKPHLQNLQAVLNLELPCLMTATMVEVLATTTTMEEGTSASSRVVPGFCIHPQTMKLSRGDIRMSFGDL